MKFTAVVFHLIAFGASASLAFSPQQLAQPRSISMATYQRAPTHIFSSQWDDEDEVVASDENRKSFLDAGDALKDEEDNKRMDDMGDYDANPAYNSADIDRVREAIKERTESLGIGEAKMTQEFIQQAQEKAKEQVGNRGGGQALENMLDLTQISQTAPRGQDDETPAMFYEPGAEMTDEEQKEADPDGQMSIPDQAMKEISLATWPTPFAAVKEVFLLVAIVLATSSIIIFWDNFLREFYTGLGFIPTPEEILSGSENLVLPDGWTSGMSEDDFMKFQDEVATTATTAKTAIGNSGFPDL